MLAMVPSFVAAVEVGVTSVDSFSSFAELVMLGGSNLLVGAAIFAVVGIVVHPVLFAAVAGYLPGKQWSTRGLVFALVLWTGFLPGFYTGQAGLALAGYVALSLFGHVAYGIVLGTVYGRYQTADYAV
jgi:cytochrome c oxidase subunit 1